MPNRRPVIVIDPGHGGSAAVGGSSSNNATGPNGLLEKNLTLDLARRLPALLSTEADVVLTRDRDVNLSLADRAQAARDRHADLFLSIHFNGFRNPQTDGTEIWIARQANQQSRAFAQTILRHVLAVTGVQDRGVKQSDLGVILPDRHAPQTAACLLEVAFLTNPAQAQRLTDEAYRQRLAAALAEAVRTHVGVPAAAQSMAAAIGGYGAPEFAQAGGAYYEDFFEGAAEAAALGGVAAVIAARGNPTRPNRSTASAVELRMEDPKVAKEKRANFRAMRCEANRQLKAQWEKVKQEMVRIAIQEFQVTWNNGANRETEAAMKQVITRYWQDGVFPGEAVPGDVAIPAESWSAAFIAWVVKEAGGRDRFSRVHNEATDRPKFRPRAHWRYVAPSLINQKKLSPLNPFWAYAIDAVTPKVGDIVVKSREGSGLTLNQLANLTGNASDGEVGWKSHGDIVVRVDQDRNEIKVIGGNVGGTVQETTIRLNANGFVQSTGGGNNDHLAIVRINTDQYILPECV